MAYSRLSTRNSSGIHPNFRGLGFLGDAAPLSAADALQKAIAAYSGDHVNPNINAGSWMEDAESQITSGQLGLAWIGASCAGQPAPNLNLFNTASGLALSGAAAGIGIATATTAITAATGALLGAATMGVGLIISVIGMIFAHHAAAVKRDISFGCQVFPAVNNAFTLIGQAVAAGQTTAAAAAQALPEIYSRFMSAGGASGSASGPGGIPSSGEAINDHPYCNANCEFSIILLAMIFYWQAQYQALADQQAAEAAQAAAAQQAAESAAAAPAPSASNVISPSTPATPASPTIPISAITESPILAPAFSMPAWGWLALAAAAAWAVL